MKNKILLGLTIGVLCSLSYSALDYVKDSSWTIGSDWLWFRQGYCLRGRYCSIRLSHLATGYCSS